ncbi:MBL fold metallo-hydrolase [Alkalicoccus urumqiensis]|uniref:Metallo-beta-lactamase domain-containing protein n=1 Tax=Alkalicoccus urumqiensis TaxID=1548213 RepID=A0A2P6MGU4_ALKUR|nr:MBL fold metallo-hydrolase [Alkalicoccus urumqiensis]PRO65501.1 hypothetical protein C6I21_09535 [Alkalicoccus urumqiensis]
MEQFQAGENMVLTWLDGGVTHMDGGAMFGVVPRPLWEKKYPPNEKHQIELRSDPVLIQTKERTILLESGIGRGRLSEKAMRNFGVTEESRVEESLQKLGLAPGDIDVVLMTHMHFDHACGLVKETADGPVPAFPNAEIWCTAVEWEEMKHPNIRSRNTYFKENWEPVAHQVKTFTDTYSPEPGITMIHTGGHSAGHAVLRLETEAGRFWHFADIMPTHAHQNVLWVLAYDDYPMDSIAAKQTYTAPAVEAGDWIFFYHDAVYRMIRWENVGRDIAGEVRRNK